MDFEADRLRVWHLPSRPSHLANSTGVAVLNPSDDAGLHDLPAVPGLILNQTNNLPGDRAGLRGDALGLHTWQTARELLFQSQATMVKELDRLGSVPPTTRPGTAPACVVMRNAPFRIFAPSFIPLILIDQTNQPPTTIPQSPQTLPKKPIPKETHTAALTNFTS
ncbi:hypothetical protein PGTUg99_018245 [Puccinia graminis f. sp. tritici]|uniref:Uncharacterized protein n=1 Tax=Puccinia graminis f. sp. tritici TaxID=56615 RepID=A0A5B0SLR9_PUCGR|nr:hypothetical protein PGTUg99_018245 [Puccinia graminis f. sp. tritici]